MNRYSRAYLRERFLAEQQDQLAKDATLADPADAYRVLLEELYAERDDRWTEHSEQAA